MGGRGRVTLSCGPREVTGGPRAPVSVGAYATDEVLNGLGTARNAVGEGRDRHFGEPDDRVVPSGRATGAGHGFCGGGALLRAGLLAEVGLFDPAFFAY